MKKNILLFLFFLSLLADLGGIIAGNKEIQYIAKPLIVLSLIIYFILVRHSYKENLPYFIVLALGFSWVGDLLLLFDTDPDFFLGGLSSFLIAHVFYILFFYSARKKENIRPAWYFFLLVAAYYALLITLLYPRLGDMRLPVTVYGIVISAMFVLALHMKFIRNKAAGQWMMAGAGLFVLSDSLLAFNKFYAPFDGAGILIMLSYAAAQFCITRGAVYYFKA